MSSSPCPVVLIAHGSRRAQANDEVRALAAALAQALVGTPFVQAAFLELAEPDIPTALDRAAQACAGAAPRRVVVVPHFLATGRHVADDIPAALDAARARHPTVCFEQRPFTGQSPAMVALLTALVEGDAA